MLVSGLSEAFSAWLSTAPRFAQALSFLASCPEAFVVGGTVRDLLLGRPVADLDILVPEGAIHTGRTLARELDVAFYVLDAERDVCRLVLDTTTHIDITKYRLPSLQDDLQHRDFTINALAWRVGDESYEIIDNSLGLTDLQQGIIRIVSEVSFADDPLRVLRAVRFAGALGFTIEPHTLQHIQQDRNLLPQISPERIRDEFLSILALPNPLAALELFVNLDLSPFSLGMDSEALAHGLKSLAILFSKTAMLIPSDRVQSLEQDWQQPLTADRPRWLLNRLALLLWGAVGESDVWSTLCERLVLSGRECAHLQRIRQGLSWLSVWPCGWWRDPERIYAYYDALDESGTDAAVFHAALLPSASSAETRDILLSAWYEQHDRLIAPPRLLTGDDVQQLTGASGPEIGRLLKKLTLAQVRGEITDAVQAKAWLSKQTS